MFFISIITLLIAVSLSFSFTIYKTIFQIRISFASIARVSFPFYELFPGSRICLHVLKTLLMSSDTENIDERVVIELVIPKLLDTRRKIGKKFESGKK